VGLADSAIAAYAATFPRFAKFPARRTFIVPAGRDAEFLAPYPIGLLGLDEDLAETCQALGLSTVGQLATLEPGEVEARFGPAGLAAHRLARGLDTRGPSAPRDDTVPAAACDLGGAVATAEPLLFVLKGALGSLATSLRDRALAARELTITLTLDDGSQAEKAVRPARPTSHEGALFDHVRAALEDWSLPEPVTALALRATVTVPASGEQGDLLVPRWADPAAIEAAFDRIRGREGADAVAVPESRDAHLPEDAGAWRVSEAASGLSRADGPRRSAPRTPRDAFPRTRLHGPSSEQGPLTALRLLTIPEPVRVRLGRAGLEAFRHGETWHDVTAWSGPERLTPRWWRRDTTPGARDYYTARDRDGALWLLFRRGTQWHLAGWWD
jgi:protein ImuB